MIENISSNKKAASVKICLKKQRLKKLEGQKNQFKTNSVISIKINSARAIENFVWAKSVHAALY